MEANIESILDILKKFKENVRLYSYQNSYDEYSSTLNKLSIYIEKFSESPDLKKKLDSIPVISQDDSKLRNGYNMMTGLLDALIEDIEISKSIKVISAGDYNYYKKRDESNENFKKRINELEEHSKKEYEDKKVILARVAQLQSDITAKEVVISKVESLLAKANEDFSQHNSIIEEALAAKTKLDGELTSTKSELSRYKEAAQKTEIARNSTNFHNQAETNKKVAIAWGVCTVVAITAFLVVIYIVFSKSGELFEIANNITEIKNKIEPALVHQLILIEVAKKMASKLLMISIIIYFITFLVKNYNAQMHNYIINSHKANALRSTVDLIGTAKQDDGNDKIILQATQAIFTPQKSGYQGAESEPSSPNLITNVVDAVSGGKKN